MSGAAAPLDEPAAAAPDGPASRGPVVAVLIGLAVFLCAAWVPALWLDEATTIVLIRRSWSELLAVGIESDPALLPYYVLVKPVLDLGGGMWTVRLVSVLAGADPLLLPLLQQGGAGCITATSNLAGKQLRTVFDKFADPAAAAEVEAAQKRIVALREASNSFPQIPTIKAMVARRYAVPSWANTRPPLVRLTDEQIGKLGPILDKVDADFPA